MNKRKKKTKKKVFLNEDQGIEVYILRTTTNDPVASIAKKFSICTGVVRRWVRRIESDPKLRAKAEKVIKSRSSGVKRTPMKVPSKGTKKVNNGVEEIMRLTEENNYLRWCNLGLEQGFIERLLEEKSK
jgi:hypothetical protein